MIEFEPSFFEEETRNGFTISTMMKKAWAAQMEVLMEVDRICKANDLQYFVNWGTLLGAVRHQGFIPWDDDIDITMKRTDYMKFLKIAPQQFEPWFEIINIEQEKQWSNMISRVINGRSIRTDEDFLNRFHRCPYILGIDIDVLDNKATNEQDDELQLQMVKIVLHAANIEEKYRNGEITFDEMKQFLAQIEEMCGVKLDYNKPLSQQLRVLGDRLSMIYGDDESDELQYVVSRILNRPNYHIPKEWYDETIYMPFENIQVPVPAGYEGILKLQFGQDYMTPRTTGAGHDYPFYKEQEEVLTKKLIEVGVLPDIYTK